MLNLPGGLKDGKDLLMFYRQYGEIDPEESPPMLFCHGKTSSSLLLSSLELSDTQVYEP